MAGAIARGVSRVTKAATRGRPKGSKKGRKAIPEAIKKKAKDAGFPSVKKWKEAGSPEPKKKDKGKKDSGRKRTRREERELAALERAQRADDMQVVGNPRRRATGPDYLAERYKVAEGLNSPALSKVIPPKMSAAQRRARITQGLVGNPPPARPGHKGKQVSNIGEFAPPRGQVADEMGLTSRKQSGLGEGLPSLEELSGMGFQIKEEGGQIKGKSKKSSKKYKGWGAARKPKGGK
tara:strand:+ start:10254 stop:10961 length:708 start_codon:yes stop_codon:yes gene_type:complete